MPRPRLQLFSAPEMAAEGALRGAWRRTHVVSRDPGCRFDKDGAISIGVPPDGFEGLGNPEQQEQEPASSAARTGVWRTITPNVLRLPGTAEPRYRMYYTRSGPSYHYSSSHGRILSARSDDGVRWSLEEGVRLMPRAGRFVTSDPAESADATIKGHMTPKELRAVCPEVVLTLEVTFRMYYESQLVAPAGSDKLPPATIRSAISVDGLEFTAEPGERLADPAGRVSYGSPRCIYLDNGSVRLYSRCADVSGDVNVATGGTMSIVCADSNGTTDGLDFGDVSVRKQR